jgi:2-succinyl-6-hydroxy-2,4-cyclohexadiene-1-carboxylate synthase
LNEQSVECVVGSGTGDPVTLHVEIQGAGPPLLMLHGFTGSGQNLRGIAAALQDCYTLYRVDLVGHGRSRAADNAACYTMSSCLTQLIALLDGLGIDRAHWFGYSMGARVALSLCAAYPERVCSALLVGVSPGIEEAVAREQRIAADALLARRLREQGLAQFVDYWMALPLFASQSRLGSEYLAAQRAQRLANCADALAASLEGMGCGAMEPLQRALVSIHCPVCLVAGAEDAKFAAIARAMQVRLPRSELALIAGAGHAAHIERPQAFAALARRFYRQIDTEIDAAPRRWGV